MLKKKICFCPEITAKISKLGIKILEVPLNIKEEITMKEKIKFYDGIELYLLFLNIVNMI